MNPLPIQPLQQRRELCSRQPHHCILNVLPAEFAILEPLGEQTYASAIPINQLYPISSLRSEYIHGARERSATYTGAECTDWAGGVAGKGYAIQGNILEGSRVIALMEEAWLGSDPREPLSRRLLAALSAGDAVGGDKRGRQSAALFVAGDEGGYGGGDDVIVDLRVDDHHAPIPELARLLTIHEMLFGKPDPKNLMPLTGALAEEVRSLLGAQGFIAGDVTTTEIDRVLAAWAGVENLEERLVPGHLDPVVLAHLRRLNNVPS